MSMKFLSQGWRYAWASTVVLAALIVLFPSAPAQAREGDTRSTLFLGTSAFASTDASTFGTTFGFRFSLEIQNDLLWDTGVSFTSTSGEKTVNDTTFEISANTTTVSTGLTYLFNRGEGSKILPFAGGGVSVASYEIDFDYPDSVLGKTSGTAPGIFGHGGVEFQLGERSTFILQYVASVHSVERESGGSASLISTGFVLSFRLNV